MLSSSSVSLQARALATAVMDAVNSQAFTNSSPPHYFMVSQPKRVLRRPLPVFQIIAQKSREHIRGSTPSYTN